MSEQTKQSMARQLGIPKEILFDCATRAYDLLEADVLGDAIVMARGLVAADSANSYFRTLLATALFRQNQCPEALKVIDKGLLERPGNPQLRALRNKIEGALAARPSPASTPVTPANDSASGKDREAAVELMFAHSMRC